MIIDSPYWVRHDDGGGISGLDISPNGRRLATCGTAPQIVIWNMLPILDEKAEKDASVPKVLGVIQDSQGSVLTVKFSHSGTMLAAGCDAAADSAVLIFKQSSAPAVQKQLGCKITSIENWRPVASLRGHQLDVTALSWSPGDEYLASASMDQKVYIWGIGKDGRGHLIHSLDNQHNGWVKGIAFDPIGRYLATQGRNGVKVWDVHSGWTLVTHQRKPFERSPDAGFRYKMSWSPDGEVLIAMNGAESKHLCVCCFTRSTWELAEMVGHRGAVLVSAANPRLFYLPEQLVQQRLHAEDGQEEGKGQHGAAGEGAVTNSAKAGAAAGGVAKYAEVASLVFAAGSNDKTITLWCSDLPRPMLQISQIHGGGIVDMAWTPDGYTLIAASLDDRVSVMRFACSELGRAVTDKELQEYIEKAAAEGQQVADIAQHDTLMDAELTALAGELDEPAADAAVDAAFPTPPRPAARPAAAPAAAAAAAAAGAGPRSAGAAVASGGSALDRRLMPQGGGATAGILAQPRQQQQQQAGQKRLHPTAVGVSPAAAGAAGALPPAKRANTGVQLAPQQQQQQRQTGGRAAAAGGGGRGGGWVLPPPGIKANLEVQLALVAVKRTDQQQQQDQYQSVTLVVENRRGSSSSSSSSTGRTAVAEVSLHLGGKKEGHEFWRDKLQEHVVAAAGNLYFSAAVTTSGLLYTWRPKGTPLLPPLALGCPPVSISVEGAWELLIVGADGGMTTLNMAEKRRECSGPVPAPNLAPILAAAAPGTSLQDVWITSSSSGSSSSNRPLLIGRTQLAVLTDGSGWLFHPGLGLWVMLKAAAGAAAAAAGGRGTAVAVAAGSVDAERLRAKAGGHDILQGLQQVVSQQLPDVAAQRQEAYWQLTAAELLEDPNGYQRALGLLVTLLARDKDVERLKELSEDLLGPVRWDPSMLPGGSGPKCDWSNTVIGLDKRTLLLQTVIRAMARERLSLAQEVNQHLQSANLHAQQEAAKMAAAAAQAAAAAAGGAGFGTPLAAGFSSQQGLPMGFHDLRLAPRTAVPAAAAAAAAGGSGRGDGAGRGTGNAAAAAAVAVANGPLGVQQVQRRESGGESGDTAPYAPQPQQQQQQGDSGSGVAGASGVQARNSAVQAQQELLNGQQQQLNGPQPHGAAAVANGTRQTAGATPRRLQPTPVDLQQQQREQQQWEQPSAASGGPGAAVSNGVEGPGRIPLQEQQQPHALATQHTPGKQQQQQQPAEKAVAHT